jgi:threonine dehydrogenase-like Zn-dependent dehydrogenase
VFTAHESQLYRIPDSISDENALMVEPFSCGLHAVLQNPPEKDDTVLVLGAGTIGLGVLAALQALDMPARVLVAARHPFQAEAARRLGATKIISGDLYEAVAGNTNAKIEKPIIGKRIMIGGADLTCECVGSDGALDDALRLTRSGGRVAVVGVPGIAKGIDWSSIFVKELQVHAAFGYHHAEQYQGRTWATFELAIDLMQKSKIDLGWMVTHKFKLNEYKKAFKMFSNKGRHQMIKAVFEFD